MPRREDGVGELPGGHRVALLLDDVVGPRAGRRRTRRGCLARERQGKSGDDESRSEPQEPAGSGR